MQLHAVHTRYTKQICMLILILSFTSKASAQYFSSPSSAASLDNQSRQGRDFQKLTENNDAVTREENIPISVEDDKTLQVPPGILIRQVKLVYGDEETMELLDSEVAGLKVQMKPLLGKRLTSAEIQKIASLVTKSLRRKGLTVGQAVIPDQNLTSGILHLVIMPGRFDAARLKDTGPLRPAFVESLADNFFPEGEIIYQDDLERSARLLKEIPGVNPVIILDKGRIPGTLSPVISVSEAESVRGWVGMDNHGAPSTGREQLNAGVAVNNLAGIGDQFLTDMEYSRFGDGVMNGLLDYSLLIPGENIRVGIGYSRLDYRLEYWEQMVKGYSQDVGGYVSWPVIRKLNTQMNLRFDAGRKVSADNYPRFDFFEGGTASRSETNTIRLTGYGSTRWSEGVSLMNLGVTLGKTRYVTKLAEWLNYTDVNKKDGRFEKFNYSATHLQELTPHWSVYVSVTGQKAMSDLDSAEKLLLGGPSAVRAYEVTEGSVDSGVFSTLELQRKWSFPTLVRKGKESEVMLAGFYDQGTGVYYEKSGWLMADNRITVSGAGVYTRVSTGGGMNFTLTLARRTGEALSLQSDRNKFWFTSQLTF